MRVAVIGDSVTIDTYPDLDAKERFGTNHSGLGAGSLLFKNNDVLFPEFEDSDLDSQCPDNNLTFFNLGTDGGTMTSIPRQVSKIRNPEELDWLFVTVGGNDLLLTFSKPSNWSQAKNSAGTEQLSLLMGEYSDMVNMLVGHFPKAKIVLGTVYDPTDGTGFLDPNQKEPLPIGFLTVFNNFIKQQAGRGGRVSVVDIWKSFISHGTSAPMLEGDCYYWPTSIIEPNIYGASKVRELWLEAMGIEAGKLWQPR